MDEYMKYIKLYESFTFINYSDPSKHINESIEDDIKQDIIEICYDITDDGKIIVDIFLSEDEYEQPVEGEYNLFVCRNFDNVFIDETVVQFYEIKEVFLRIKDYLGNRFIDFRVDSIDHGGMWKEFVLDNNTKNIKGEMFSIKYKVK